MSDTLNDKERAEQMYHSAMMEHNMDMKNAPSAAERQAYLDALDELDPADKAFLLKIEDELDVDVPKSVERLAFGPEDYADAAGMYMEYLEKFPENQNIIKLRQAVEAGDSKMAEAEVHTLKGVGLNLGLLPVVDASMDMLMDLRDGEIESGMAQIDDVEEAFHLIADAVQEWIDETAE